MARVRRFSAANAVKHGIGYIPRERRVEGLVLFLSVSANITLADLVSFSQYGLIDGRRERELAKDWISRLKIRTPNIHALCLGLSARAAEIPLDQLSTYINNLQSVEARLQPNDIDQVRLGQKAFTRFSAFNSSCRPAAITAAMAR